uniref:Uncharacterized protein n=1 Tax=Triticum urartu TaxID=4572 RepID=A0A8R7TKE4_TRIUA
EELGHLRRGSAPLWCRRLVVVEQVDVGEPLQLLEPERRRRTLLVAGLVVGELQEVLDGPAGRRQERRGRHLLRCGGDRCRPGDGGGRRRLGLGGRRVGVGVGAVDGAEADADAGGDVALVVGGERALDVDGVVAVTAEERPVVHAEDEGRLVLAHVAAREAGGGLERQALVLAGQLVGGVDLHVAARAQRRLVRAAHHRRRRALARVALDPHAFTS